MTDCGFLNVRQKKKKRNTSVILETLPIDIATLSNIISLIQYLRPANFNSYTVNIQPKISLEQELHKLNNVELEEQTKHCILLNPTTQFTIQTKILVNVNMKISTQAPKEPTTHETC